MNEFLQWLTTWHIGDFAGILGLLVSIAGFAVTIWQIRQARTIAEQVRMSVKQVRQDLERRIVTVDLNELIYDLEEIKDMHRTGAIDSLAKRYAAARTKVVRIKTSVSGLSSRQKARLQPVS